MKISMKSGQSFSHTGQNSIIYLDKIPNTCISLLAKITIAKAFVTKEARPITEGD
jgi:hypothetical protein